MSKRTADKPNGCGSVADLGPGQRRHIREIAGQGAIRQRLLDMGILPSASVEVERVAPSGNPIWIKVDRLQLSLRREEARCVIVDC